MAATKPAGTWTYDDLFALPDDGRRYEIIEGEIYEMPSPSWNHATTIMNLIALLLPVVARLDGLLRTAPLDVFFPGADPVEPDILVILPGSNAVGGQRGVEGPPDLVIEVLSPSNRGHDLLTKRALYARAGVREYWIVDPDARTVEILALDRDAFHAVERGASADRIASPLLGALPFGSEAIFAGIDEIGA
jgi:Uma2 family endonuclease